ncbi:MAG: dihydroorotase [Arenicella sp.]
MKQTTSIIIVNGHVIDPANQFNAKAHIVITGNKIAHIETQLKELSAIQQQFAQAEVFDATNKLVTPGLVDLRARFREPGQEYKATIASETYAAAKSGITSVCAQPDTDPIVDRPSVANTIREKSRLGNGARIHPLSALTHQLKGEMLGDIWTMSKSGCSGTSNAKNIIPSVLMQRRAMQYAASFGIRVHLYPQDHELLGNGCVHEGLTSTRLGLPSVPAAAEIVGLARDIALIETTGVKAHFMGLSCARSVEMVDQAQKKGLDITADVDIHHLLLNECDMKDFDSNFHIQPPLRTSNDQLALIEGIKQGVITAICSDHQPHDADAKLASFSETEPGISGIEILLPGILKLAEEHTINLETLLSLVTDKPAKVAEINAGSLSIGSTADCIIVDHNTSWELKVDDILSQGKNTPYIGETMKGRCITTIMDGQLVK